MEKRKRELIATGVSWRSQEEMEPFRQFTGVPQSCCAVPTSKLLSTLIGLGSSLAGTSSPASAFSSSLTALFPGPEANLCLRCLLYKVIAPGRSHLGSQQCSPAPWHCPKGCLNSFQISFLSLTQRHCPTSIFSSAFGYGYSFPTLFRPLTHGRDI